GDRVARDRPPDPGAYRAHQGRLALRQGPQHPQPPGQWLERTARNPRRTHFHHRLLSLSRRAVAERGFCGRLPDRAGVVGLSEPAWRPADRPYPEGPGAGTEAARGKTLSADPLRQAAQDEFRNTEKDAGTVRG